MTKKEPKFWYFIYEDACVLCGSGSVYKERRELPKPKKWEERHEYTEFACGSHFA